MNEKYILLAFLAVGVGAFVWIKGRGVDISPLSGPAGAAATAGTGSTPGTGDTNVDTATNGPTDE
jgi:hypothetical protein